MNIEKNKKNIWLSASCLAIALGMTACGSEGETDKDSHAGHDHGSAATEEAASNSTPIPATVRQNLGITFAKATYRAVNDMIVVPGSFELMPSAQHQYPLPLSGRIDVLVKPLQKISAGDVLFTLDAPEWKELQLRLSEADAQRAEKHSAVLMAKNAQKAARDMFAGEQANKSQDGDIFHANIIAAQAALKAAHVAFDRLVSKASSITALSKEELMKEKGSHPLWYSLEKIAIRATRDAVVREIMVASGVWQDAGAEIIHTVQPNLLRFHGQALQADLGKLKNGQRVLIRPPAGHKDSYDNSIVGTLLIGVSGDADTRLINVYVDVPENLSSRWARPQVAVMAEITVAGSADDEELAIPMRGVITDGLDKIIFRRDPNNKDAVLRIKADLGANDGTWVIVESGLVENDQVVIDGIYELKLATTGQKTTTGHFHADGTFHDGED